MAGRYIPELHELHRRGNMEKNQSLITTDDQHPHHPALVEAEKMFQKLATVAKETAGRAYDLFLARGAQFGNQAEDWLRAEMETLRAAPAKITETKDIINVLVAAPGFRPDEIEMSIKGNLLIISGETSAEQETEEANTFYNEWRSDRFLRTLTLPSEVETENVEALLKDGVLTLILKKKAEEEAVKVAVKTA